MNIMANTYMKCPRLRVYNLNQQRQNRCIATHRRKCGIKIGFIGSVPYGEAGCEWVKETRC